MSRPTAAHHRYLRRHGRFALLVAVLIVGGAIYYWRSIGPAYAPSQPQASAIILQHGDVLGIDNVQTFSAAQTEALARQNYGATTLPAQTGITKITFHYRSELPNGEPITIYGRAYLPSGTTKNLPIFAFAPGTTGIGDKCAPSLEEPAKSNWANYDSHMATYASQGFATVTTDYEGMRDPGRIHHYMVGELEGRAVLDSVRALRRLPQSRGRLSPSDIFFGGYSQGGHAAFWADKIAESYAPDVKAKGVVGYGPVMSVKQTLTDVVHAANINWFGPYVLYSYHDYYHADYGDILLPHWQQTLDADVPAHCIDTDLPFWGHNPATVYTPQFIQAALTDTLASAFPDFNRDLDLNAVGADSTSTAKRINSGLQDNVVLPAQQQAAAATLCSSSAGPVELAAYNNTTHYNTMVHSLGDTLGWMHTLIAGGHVPSTCPGASPEPTPSPTGTPAP